MGNRTAARRRPRLIAEIALVIACKLFIIFCLWWFFFSPEHRTTVTPDSMSGAIFGQVPVETNAGSGGQR